MRVESARDGKVWRQEYERGKPTGPVDVELRPTGRARGTTTAFKPDTRDLRDHRVRASRRSSQRLRESAYLNKGVWITLDDERGRTREQSFYFEGGLVSLRART